MLPCICRVQKRLIGEGCDHSEENCLVISSKANAFKTTAAIKTLTKEEALEVLAQADKEGLVHSTNNVREGVDYICNCCTCSCGVLRGLTVYGSPKAVGRSHFYAAVEEDLCAGCGLCVDRCPVNAIEVDDICSVEKNRCIGCGLCVTTCPEEALRLQRKEGAEIETPPLDEEEWREQRIASRAQER